MKAVVAAFNQEKALVGAFSVITNLRMQLFEALQQGQGGQPQVLAEGPRLRAEDRAAGGQAAGALPEHADQARPGGGGARRRQHHRLLPQGDAAHVLLAAAQCVYQL